MKPKKQKARLDRKISNFKSDRYVNDANSKHPGSYHQPGSLKKC